MSLSVAIILFCLAAAAAAGLGLTAFALWPGAARRGGAHLEAAAGGALLVMGLFLLAPEALHLFAPAWAAVLGGAALGAALQRGAAALAGPRAGAATLLAGLGLHSVLDGAAFAIAFAAHPVLGLGGAVGLVLHDAPKALFAFVLLRRTGLRAAGAAAGAMLTAAGLTALGAAASAPFAERIGDETLGLFAGLAAGLLAWSGAACLLALRRPQGWSREKAGRVAAALAGAMLAALLGLIGHSH